MENLKLEVRNLKKDLWDFKDTIEINKTQIIANEQAINQIRSSKRNMNYILFASFLSFLTFKVLRSG